MTASPLASSPRKYVGRYAPSPTGPLHFGSLVAAVGSYLDARAAGGRWLLRIDDLDRPRTEPGTADAILRTLERCGFEWDGPVLNQSARDEAYAAALLELRSRGHAFPCACSRQEVADGGVHGIEGPVYPGTCRDSLPAGREARAWRVRVDDIQLCFDDGAQGRYCQVLARDVGDFVVRRADGLFAYQLATVVDDARQGVTHVVRGADLLVSTPRQIWLQRCLGLPTPAYMHIPIAVDGSGKKLSKQTGAVPVDDSRPGAVLFRVLEFLDQAPVAELRREAPAAIWDWAVAHWDASVLAVIGRTRVIEAV